MSVSFIRIAKRIARRIIGRPIVGRSILVYHRVATVDFDPWNLAVTPIEFERQLASFQQDGPSTQGVCKTSYREKIAEKRGRNYLRRWLRLQCTRGGADA